MRPDGSGARGLRNVVHRLSEDATRSLRVCDAPDPTAVTAKDAAACARRPKLMRTSSQVVPSRHLRRARSRESPRGTALFYVVQDLWLARQHARAGISPAIYRHWLRSASGTGRVAVPLNDRGWLEPVHSVMICDSGAPIEPFSGAGYNSTSQAAAALDLALVQLVERGLAVSRSLGLSLVWQDMKMRHVVNMEPSPHTKLDLRIIDFERSDSVAAFPGGCAALYAYVRLATSSSKRLVSQLPQLRARIRMLGSEDPDCASMIDYRPSSPQGWRFQSATASLPYI